MERGPNKRPLLIWIVLGAGALLATIVTLWSLSSTVYSAEAFVQRYYDAVDGDNVAELLRTPGVAIAPADLSAMGLPASTSTALLRPGLTTSGPSQVRVSTESVSEDGVHTVSVSYRIDGTQHSARYQVAPDAAMFGILPRWRFVTSPLALLSVTVQNGSHFSVGPVTLDARAAGEGDPTASTHVGHYLAVAPASYTVHFDSELVAAAPSSVLVLPDAENTAIVDVVPTAELVDRVQSKLDDFLAQCVTQRVLQPAGCPFGITIDDRVLGDPEWSIVQNPVVTLAPGEGGFVMPATPGITHVVVPVQSLYDGAKSTFDQDVNYQVSLTVHIRDDGSIAIQLR